MPAPLGQHFLTRPEIAGFVADALLLSKKDTVLEVGPGKGILTHELLERVGKVVAIEKDPDLFAGLSKAFAKELAEERLVLILGDVRTCNPSVLFSKTPYYLVANIPYYITGLIMRLFLTAEHQPEGMSLLMQKEVAERICAQDGKESLLSLGVKAYGAPRYVRTVKAGAFSPAPKVDSAILAIEHISRKRFEHISEEAFFKVLHTAFGEKRKTLGKTLKNKLPPEAFVRCGVSPQARPETVSLEGWFCLTLI